MARNLAAINRLDNDDYTYLTADMAVGVTALTVRNIDGFAINQILIIGDFGIEGSEIIKTSASVAPTGSTISLASATLQPHPSGTKITLLDFDQAEYSHAATVGGSKSVINTIAIRPDKFETTLTDTTYSSGYYFVRYKNSITNAFSDYSDPIPYTGYELTSARVMIDNALAQINEESSDSFPDEFGFAQINNCQSEVLRKRKRWSWMQEFDYELGTVSTADWKLAMPDDIDDEFTNKSTLSLHIAGRTPMTWIDKNEWNRITAGSRRDFLAVALLVGASTMTLDNSVNFDPSGTVYVGGVYYSYTANDTATGILTLENVVATGEDQLINATVWQGVEIGDPRYFGAWGGYFYMWPIVGEFLDGRTAYTDYYRKLTTIDTDTDNIVVPDPNLVQDYLSEKYLLKKKNGEVDTATQSWETKWKDKLYTLIRKETSNIKLKLKPRINNFARKYGYANGDTRAIRLGTNEP